MGTWWWVVAGLGVTGLVLLARLVVFLVPTDDDPQDPDVVVVLGGAGRERAELGVELAVRHDAVLVLSSTAAVFGTPAARTRGLTAICIDPVPGTTAGEAATVARLAAEHGWQHVTVATSAFHTSRSRLLFRQCLGAARVSVVGARSPGGARPGLRRMLREGAGVLAGLTIRRAC